MTATLAFRAAHRSYPRYLGYSVQLFTLFSVATFSCHASIGYVRGYHASNTFCALVNIQLFSFTSVSLSSVILDFSMSHSPRLHVLHIVYIDVCGAFENNKQLWRVNGGIWSDRAW
jgi:hypothetical protein